jgi:hypothetical protein
MDTLPALFNFLKILFIYSTATAFRALSPHFCAKILAPETVSGPANPGKIDGMESPWSEKVL